MEEKISKVAKALAKTKNAITKYEAGDRSYQDDLSFYTGVVVGLLDFSDLARGQATQMAETVMVRQTITPEEAFDNFVSHVAYELEMDSDQLREQIAQVVE
jgi:hypothetical protein